MREFEAKKPASAYVYSVGFFSLIPGTGDSPGATITSCEVAIAVYDKSGVDDPNPSAMLDGAAFLNVEEVTIEQVAHPIGTVVMANIVGGVIGCIYVVSFTADLSDGEILSEDVLLPVKKYEPVT